MEVQGLRSREVVCGVPVAVPGLGFMASFVALKVLLLSVPASQRVSVTKVKHSDQNIPETLDRSPDGDNVEQRPSSTEAGCAFLITSRAAAFWWEIP